MGKLKNAIVGTSLLVGGMTIGAGGWLASQQWFTTPETYRVDKVGNKDYAVKIINKAIYDVNVGEEAVVLGMGGLWERKQTAGKWRIRLPFETTYVANVNEVRKFEKGYRTQSADVETTYAKGDFSNESRMVSGDEGEIILKYAVQFRVNNLSDYLFNVRDVVKTIDEATESGLREVVGKNDYDMAMTTEKDRIGDEATKLAQRTLNQYGIGAKVLGILIQGVEAPTKEVTAAFDSINNAKQQVEGMIQGAEQLLEKEVGIAKGEKERLISSAKGRSQKLINEAEGDVTAYLEVYEGYKVNPQLQRKRLAHETMREIFENGDITVIDKKVEGVLPYMNVDKMKKGAKK